MGNIAPTETKTETCECGKPIDESCYNSKLLRTVKKYNRHLIICTPNQIDWAAKIDEENGSFAQQLKKQIKREKERVKRWSWTNDNSM